MRGIKNFKRAPKERRTSREGYVFHSIAERKRWETLQGWQLAGEIRNLKRQVKYELILPDGTPILTPTGRTATYTDDFEYEMKRGDEWVYVIEDFKGHKKDGSQFRIAVFEAIYKRKVTIKTR